MEKVSGFIIVWKLRFHTIINAPRGSHCSGMEECRLRDPPQAENPASQDSFLSYRKLCFHTIINALRGCALGARVDGCRGNRASARECAKSHSLLSYRKLRFLYDNKRSARIALQRNGRMSLARPAAGGESCFAGFFFIYS